MEPLVLRGKVRFLVGCTVSKEIFIILRRGLGLLVDTRRSGVETSNASLVASTKNVQPESGTDCGLPTVVVERVFIQEGIRFSRENFCRTST